MPRRRSNRSESGSPAVGDSIVAAEFSSIERFPGFWNDLGEGSASLVSKEERIDIEGGCN